jgi:hypothetical protein
VSHEGAVRSAFQTLLEHCGRQFGWKLVPEWEIKRNHGHRLRVDRALVDEFRITHGFWEAEDTAEDLKNAEVRRNEAEGRPDLDDFMFSDAITGAIVLS